MAQLYDAAVSNDADFACAKGLCGSISQCELCASKRQVNERLLRAFDRTSCGSRTSCANVLRHIPAFASGIPPATRPVSDVRSSRLDFRWLAGKSGRAGTARRGASGQGVCACSRSRGYAASQPRQCERGKKAVSQDRVATSRLLLALKAHGSE